MADTWIGLRNVVFEGNQEVGQHLWLASNELNKLGDLCVINHGAQAIDEAGGNEYAKILLKYEY